MKVIIHMVALDLQDLQVCSEGRVAAFTCGDSPGHHPVILVNPGLYMGNLDVAAIDLLFGMLDFEIFVGGLLVGKVSPVFGENIMVRLLEDFKLGEGAVINNFRVHKDGMGWLLMGREIIVVGDCIMNCCTAAREGLRNMPA